MTDYQEQLAECQANNKNLFASVGEAGKGFGALHAASVADGVLGYVRIIGVNSK